MKNPAARVRGLAAAAAVSAMLAVPLCACSSAGTSQAASAGSTQGRSPSPSTSRAGQVAGSTAQGITVGIPAGWKVADFSKETVTAAYTALRLPGLTQKQFVSSFDSLAGVHGVAAMDTSNVKALGGEEGDVLPNLNAYCTSSGTSMSGSSALSSLRQAVSETVKEDLGTVTAQADTAVGGTPVVKTTYTPIPPAPGVSEQAVSIAAAPKPGQACYVYVTYPAAQIPGPVINTAISGISFP